MRVIIKSIVEVKMEGCRMHHKNPEKHTKDDTEKVEHKRVKELKDHHHRSHKHKRVPTTYPTHDADKHEERRKEKTHPHSHYSREESSSESPRFFKRLENANEGIKQEVNVTVNVNEGKDDCLTGCFSGFSKCFGK